MGTAQDQYERVRERVRKLEAERSEYLSRGQPIPARITYGLKNGAIELEEARLYGHREIVREAREAQRAAAERSMRDRVEAELARIRCAPTINPAEIRDLRRELGVSQYQLAAASGVYVGTISRIENGSDHRPETLRLIAAGLEFIREHTESTDPAKTASA
jgi:DNA-binding transcriptional regulator YiaG